MCYYFSWAGFLYLFWVAWKCMKGLEKVMPTEEMRSTVRALIYIYFIGWNLHTVVSSVGPECFEWVERRSRGERGGVKCRRFLSFSILEGEIKIVTTTVLNWQPI